MGYSKSGYYKHVAYREQEILAEAIVVALVQEERRKLPKLGGKKLYYKLRDELEEVGKIGRDKFFDILRRNGLLVKRKRNYAITTDSKHYFRVYKNLLRDKTLSRYNECWVADITYLRTRKGFVYLFLLTDAFSRKIVGWAVSDSLSIEGGIEALKMAMKQRDETLPLIHHSDRGIQYCSEEYVKLLTKDGISISMTEQNHCYENAMAERVNGILKDEFLLDSEFKNMASCIRSVRQAVFLYNEERPHWAIGLKTPSELHQPKAA